MAFNMAAQTNKTDKFVRFCCKYHHFGYMMWTINIANNIIWPYYSYILTNMASKMAAKINLYEYRLCVNKKGTTFYICITHFKYISISFLNTDLYNCIFLQMTLYSHIIIKMALKMAAKIHLNEHRINKTGTIFYVWI